MADMPQYHTGGSPSRRARPPGRSRGRSGQGASASDSGEGREEDEEDWEGREGDGDEDESGEDDISEGEEEERDFYAVLNVPRDATDSQLKSAYHQLSLSFHPDKHPPHQRDAATKRFNLIKLAYEVLSDPYKRAIYDELGEAGLQMESRGMFPGSGEVGRAKAMSVEEFKIYLQQRVAQIRRERWEREVGSAGSVVVGWDGRGLLGWLVDDVRLWNKREEEGLFGLAGGVHQSPEEEDLVGGMTKCFVQHGFHIPLPGLRTVLNTEVSAAGILRGIKASILREGDKQSGSEKVDKSDAEFEAQQAREKQLSSQLPPILRFSAQVGGASVVAMSQPDAQGRSRRIANSPLLAQAGLSLQLTHQFPLLPHSQPKPTKARSYPAWMEKEVNVARVLQSSNIALSHSVLGRTTTVALTRPILNNTVGMNLTMQVSHRGRKPTRANAPRNMPMIEATFSRQITRRGTFFITFGTGTRWSFMLPGFGLWGLGVGNRGLPGNQHARIGWSYRSQPGLAGADVEDEDEDGDAEEDEEPSGGPSSSSNEQNSREKGNNNDRSNNKPKPTKPSHGNTAVTAFMTANHLGNNASMIGFGIDFARTFFASSLPNRSNRQIPLHPPPNSSKGIRVGIKSALNLAGSITFTFSAIRPVFTSTRLGLSISLDPSEGGVIFNILFRRLGQKISIPIIVTKFVDAEDVVYKGFTTWVNCIAVAALGWSVWEWGVIRRLEKRERRRRRERAWNVVRREVENRRKEAEEAVEVMRPGVERKIQRERELAGLVVVKATYGLPDAKKPEDRIDVTIPVAALVDNSQLVIPGRIRKSQVLGFYDPYPGKRKALKVRYFFGDVLHEIEVPDGKGLVAPSKGHIVVDSL